MSLLTGFLKREQKRQPLQDGKTTWMRGGKRGKYPTKVPKMTKKGGGMTLQVMLQASKMRPQACLTMLALCLTMLGYAQYNTIQFKTIQFKTIQIKAKKRKKEERNTVSGSNIRMILSKSGLPMNGKETRRQGSRSLQTLI